MTKFRVGDVVRRIRCANQGEWGVNGREWVLEVGVEGTVVGELSGWLRVFAYDVPSTEYHDPEYFELVSRPTKIATPTYAPNVRPNDPTTSHIAAANIKAKRYSIKSSILDLLDKHRNGLTGQEIAEHTGHRLNSITPRFAELSRLNGSAYMRTLGKIRDSGDRRNGQIVWVINERSPT